MERNMGKRGQRGRRGGAVGIYQCLPTDPLDHFTYMIIHTVVCTGNMNPVNASR